MDKYGLIGYPLGHSFSISYFNQKFADEGINAKYENFEIPSIDILPEVLCLRVRHAIELTRLQRNLALEVDRKTKENENLSLRIVQSLAAAIDAKDTYTNGDKKLHKKALILGTGGASKAINFGLKSLGIEPIFVSRYERENALTYQQVTPEVVKEYNVIVNCTPVGMYPHTEECPQLPYEAMDNHTILYDLIYNPDQTLFMRKGAQYGADVKNGLEMLLLQAFASWEFWNGKDK